MESETLGVLPNDEGASAQRPVEADAASELGQPTGDQNPAPAPSYDHIPPEFRPDANGKWPEITPQLIRTMRGKYFTVKHPMLTNCGHRLDMVNQPKNNCENCWYQWFNTHPQLVETADQFFRTHGKGPLIGMRGEKFFKMFVRYMATVIHFMKEEEALKVAQEKTNESSSGQASGSTEGNEGEVAPNSPSIVEGGQTEGNRGDGEVA